mmetsp:Transcript_23303/g.51197  ORF Transcript_23303/g.51197 Transcript_23303/m.51197 type:complete len:136 (-) Transcript_23303:3547-3954(-)
MKSGESGQWETRKSKARTCESEPLMYFLRIAELYNMHDRLRNRKTTASAASKRSTLATRTVMEARIRPGIGKLMKQSASCDVIGRSQWKRLLSTGEEEKSCCCYCCWCWKCKENHHLPLNARRRLPPPGAHACSR